MRAVDVTIDRCLGREDSVEVGNILDTSELNKNRLLRRTRTHHGTRHTRLKRRLDLFLQEFLEVNVVYEERVLLDLLSTVHSKSFRGISVEKTSQNASSFYADVGAKGEWISKDLLVHLVRHL